MERMNAGCRERKKSKRNWQPWKGVQIQAHNFSRRGKSEADLRNLFRILNLGESLSHHAFGRLCTGPQCELQYALIKKHFFTIDDRGTRGFRLNQKSCFAVGAVYEI